MSSQSIMPSIFLFHGGGPLPLLGRQPDVAECLQHYPKTLPRIPSSILVITAHWITDTVSVSSGTSNSLLYDYSGFPAETYEYTYPAPGSPELAQAVCNLLQSANIACEKDYNRQFDHGVFVPLKLMYPEANIPVVAMSINSSLDPELHLNIGKALSPLREENILIIGSGASFHNFKYFFTRNDRERMAGIRHSHIWNDYLVETLTSDLLTEQERHTRLVNWKSAPSALEAQPEGQEEHLLPLMVLAGTATGRTEVCSLVHGPKKQEVDDIPNSNFEWR